MLLKSTEQLWREENHIYHFSNLAANALYKFEKEPNYAHIQAVKFYVDQIYNKYVGRKDVHS